MQIEGDLHSAGSVDVAGLINGNINVGEVIILETGSVKGNLQVKKIEVNGHIEGKIIADEIILGKNSVIKGNILFKVSLKTEEGAQIDGYIKGAKEKINFDDEEDLDIEEINLKPELGKPKLVKSREKEAV